MKIQISAVTNGAKHPPSQLQPVSLWYTQFSTPVLHHAIEAVHLLPELLVLGIHILELSPQTCKISFGETTCFVLSKHVSAKGEQNVAKDVSHKTNVNILLMNKLTS